MKKGHKTTEFLHFYGLCCGLHILPRIVIPVCPLYHSKCVDWPTAHRATFALV